MRLIFKICTVGEWQEAVNSGHYHGSPDDARDGFIHLSASHQLRETAAKHFADIGNLVLVAFSEDELKPHLKWETSRGGDLFPHHYGSLPARLATWVEPLPLKGGVHEFPAKAFA